MILYSKGKKLDDIDKAILQLLQAEVYSSARNGKSSHEGDRVACRINVRPKWLTN